MPITPRPSRPRIAESIERAAENLEPARVGWARRRRSRAHAICRRWIRRPDKLIEDPFGRKTVRANMHPGYQNPDAIAPSGPVDPALTVLSVQSRAGRPIAVLANYSMHYYGATPVSADYYGRFAAALARRIGAEDQAGDPPFVGIMSQGTSGDQMWMDYGQPKKDPGLDAYADAVAASAERAYRAIAYRDRVPLAMAETTLVLGRRVPDETRLAWARSVVAAMKDKRPPAHPAGSLRQGGDLSARRAPPRAEAPGHPDRRAGDHRDPQRGLRHHRAEDQGTKPLRY